MGEGGSDTCGHQASATATAFSSDSRGSDDERRLRQPRGPFLLGRGWCRNSGVVRIVVNGQEEDVPEGATIRELVAQLGLTGPVAVEVNRSIVPRAEHPSTRLSENDVLEIVHFVGGG